MNMFKSLILGSAAGLLAVGGAQAADLPVKAKAVEYVKICSLYGPGFYYIPGTDTCLKIGGAIIVDATFNGAETYSYPATFGNAGQVNRYRDSIISHSRIYTSFDTRTATEYGVVRTFADFVFDWDSADGNFGHNAKGFGGLGTFHAFIQFAGFTFGKAQSAFSPPWDGYPGNRTSFLLGGDDTATGINQISYTQQFGNGVSGTISLEEPTSYRTSNLYDFAAGAGAAGTYFAGLANGVSNYGGTVAPDIVGRVRVDQAWGLFQVAAAGHNIHAGYYNPALETTGHPDDAWGFAVSGALSIKNIPTGPGDSINLEATYANGASRYVFGGVNADLFSLYSGTGLAGAYQSVGFGAAADGVFGVAGIEKTTAWGVRGAFNHNWSPNWSSSLFGAYSALSYNGNGAALYCAGAAAAIAGQGVTYTCDPDFAYAQIGAQTIWTPVPGLAFVAEVLYTALDQKFTGVTGAAVAPGATKPTAVYEFGDQDTVTFGIRAQRNW